MVFSCAALNSYEPMRLAGTWKQYSKNAMPQLARITFHNASLRYFKWPYQAKVMKILEIVSSRMVRISALACEDCSARAEMLSSRELVQSGELNVQRERHQVGALVRLDRGHLGAIDAIVGGVTLDGNASCGANQSFQFATRREFRSA